VEPGHFYIDEEVPYLTASPDFLVSVPGRSSKVPLEVKNVNRNLLGRWSTVEELPEAVYAQVQWQAGIMKAPWCFAAALVGNSFSDFIERDYPLDIAFVATAKEAAIRFMELVQADIPPEPRAGDYRPLVKLQREAKQVYLEGFGATMVALKVAEEEKARHTAEAKKYEALVEEQKAKILLAMGDADRAIIDNKWLADVKTSVRKGYAVPETTASKFNLKEIK